MADTKKNNKALIHGFQMDKSVIYLGDTFINTNCVSMIRVEGVRSNYSWILAVVSIIYSVIMHRALRSWTWFIILVSVVWILLAKIYNMIRGENLSIRLNSGDTLYFHSNDKDFLEAAVYVMKQCINENGSCYVNFDGCVVNEGIVYGNIKNEKEIQKMGQKIKIGGRSQVGPIINVEEGDMNGPIINKPTQTLSTDNFDYQKLYDLFNEAEKKATNDFDKGYAHDAKNLIINDKKGLKEYLISHKDAYMTGIFTSIAGGALGNMIKELLSMWRV